MQFAAGMFVGMVSGAILGLMAGGAYQLSGGVSNDRIRTDRRRFCFGWMSRRHDPDGGQLARVRVLPDGVGE